ncbi:MAG: GIY-YIG nuclease family protein, partial [Planctomycetaceae bacterium]|nr:GIY-YIG nuclease family protein [Planctomycetaceae bacterium]
MKIQPAVSGWGLTLFIMKLYAYSLPDVPNKTGWLKIGETRGDVEARIKQQSHEFNLKTELVWQDAVSQDFGGVDKLIHRYLKDKGFQIAVFEDTGADSEWVKCGISDVEKAYRSVKEQLDAADVAREE